MSDDIKYGVFSWGPCIVQLKISEDFRKKLLTEAEESRKEELKFTTKLAGVIKEEYAYRQKEIFLPEISQVLGVYDQAFQKFKNKPYEQKPEYLFLYGEGNRQAITYQGVHPKNGDMYIFPSWVKHYVAPFYSDVTRISVSGNVSNSLELNKIKHYTKENMSNAPK